jgi:hypothetical protein
MKVLMLVVFGVLISTAANAGQGSSCSRLTSVDVPQRSYAQVNVQAFEQRVFFYAPDIESNFGKGFKPFQLWIVEGVYGKPFVKASGSMDESEFEKIRASRNVRATAVPIDGKTSQKPVPVTIGKQRVTLEIKVNTSFTGTDRVVVGVCR